MTLLTSEEVLSYIEGLELTENSRDYAIISRLSILGTDLFTKTISALKDHYITMDELYALPDLNAVSVEILIDNSDNDYLQRYTDLKNLFELNIISGKVYSSIPDFRSKKFIPFKEYYSLILAGRENWIVNPFMTKTYNGSYALAEVDVRSALSNFFNQDGDGSYFMDQLSTSKEDCNSVIIDKIYDEVIKLYTEPIFMEKPYSDFTLLEASGVYGFALRSVSYKNRVFRLYDLECTSQSLISRAINSMITAVTNDVTTDTVQNKIKNYITSLKNSTFEFNVNDFATSYHTYFINKYLMPYMYDLRISEYFKPTTTEMDNFKKFMANVSIITESAYSITKLSLV
jgi:hypothetical protein